MEKENIVELDRDVIKKGIEVISLPGTAKEAKEQNFAPVFCLVCKKNGKRKELSCMSYISEHYKLNIHDEEHSQLYLKAYGEKFLKGGQTYRMKLISFEPPPEQTTPNQFKCNQCEKSYKYNANLKRHVKGAHDKTEYVCQLCGLQFTYPSNLKRHVTERHSNQKKKYKCIECTYETLRKNLLHKHIKSHVRSSKVNATTGRMEHFECFICKRKKTTMSALKSHFRFVH